MKTVTFKTRAQWRKWLSQHHKKSKEVWFVFYKKDTDKVALDYEAVVEEALCYGWVDSLVRKIDEESYARKVTPRKPESNWSELNKQRVEKLLENGRMTRAGRVLVEAAKKSGRWNEAARPQVPVDVPSELEKALARNKTAKTNFQRLAPGYKKQFMVWIAAVKRQETKERRAKEAVQLLARGEKLGLKWPSRSAEVTCSEQDHLFRSSGRSSVLRSAMLQSGLGSD